MLQVFLEFGIYRIDLPLCKFGIKRRSNEKLWKAVQGAFVGFMDDLKQIIGMIFGSIGVGIPPIIGEVGFLIFYIWVFLCP